MNDIYKTGRKLGLIIFVTVFICPTLVQAQCVNQTQSNSPENQILENCVNQESPLPKVVGATIGAAGLCLVDVGPKFLKRDKFITPSYKSDLITLRQCSTVLLLSSVLQLGLLNHELTSAKFIRLGAITALGGYTIQLGNTILLDETLNGAHPRDQDFHTAALLTLGLIGYEIYSLYNQPMNSPPMSIRPKIFSDHEGNMGIALMKQWKF